jgi:hypothetical protein
MRKKGDLHVEKRNAERKARPKDQQDARRVYQSCYKAAVNVEQEAKRPLPGTMNISSMERITVDIGNALTAGVSSWWIGRGRYASSILVKCHRRLRRGGIPISCRGKPITFPSAVKINRLPFPSVFSFSGLYIILLRWKVSHNDY